MPQSTDPQQHVHMSSEVNTEDFLRVLSHQLKSPVNSVETILRTIAGGFTGSIDEKTMQFVEKAIRKNEETRKIISDIVHYERFSHEKNEQVIEIEITKFLRAIAERFVTEAAGKNISLVIRIPTDLNIFLRGNAIGLDLAFANLLENAVHYTPGNGTITVELVCGFSDKHCVINVRDTGYGIAEQEREMIFEPFYRSPQLKSTIAGTGLGLSIVKRVISRHHGTISVDSTLNKGTTFTVTLPIIKTEKTDGREIPRKKVVIIGGVTAGPKAAARLRRLDESCEITIIEKSEFLSYAGCGLPSYVSGRLISPRALMTTADNTLKDVNFFETIKNINVLNKTQATWIDRKKKQLTIKDLTSHNEEQIPYDILVLATGGIPNVPQIPGIQQEGVYSFYNIEDAEAVRAVFQTKRARDVFIIGGGLIGIETAESLISAGGRVTILEKKEQILTLFDPDIALKVKHELNTKGIKVITSITIREIVKQDDSLMIMTDAGQFRADIIILSAGVKPNAELGKSAGLEIGDAGGIKVDQYLQTSDKNIYAIGDCAESIHLITKKHTYWPLGSVSTKMGRIVADTINGSRMKFNGHIGTAMFKVFNMQVGRTGLSLNEARSQGYDVETIIVSGLANSHYYPDAKYIVLKVMADRKSQMVLGAQGYGYGDVVSRIEILACAITQSLTLDAVFQLDLGYYPAFNNPIDIVQTACLVLKSKISGFVATITIAELENQRQNYRVVDVNPFVENMPPPYPDCITIPLERLRFEQLPFGKDDAIVLCSRTSSRAYEAYRYLITKGYTRLSILEGGFSYWYHTI